MASTPSPAHAPPTLHHRVRVVSEHPEQIRRDARDRDASLMDALEVAVEA